MVSLLSQAPARVVGSPVLGLSQGTEAPQVCILLAWGAWPLALQGCNFQLICVVGLEEATGRPGVWFAVSHRTQGWWGWWGRKGE